MIQMVSGMERHDHPLDRWGLWSGYRRAVFRETTSCRSSGACEHRRSVGVTHAFSLIAMSGRPCFMNEMKFKIESELKA